MTPPVIPKKGHNGQEILINRSDKRMVTEHIAKLLNNGYFNLEAFERSSDIPKSKLRKVVKAYDKTKEIRRYGQTRRYLNDWEIDQLCTTLSLLEDRIKETLINVRWAIDYINQEKKQRHGKI